MSCINARVVKKGKESTDIHALVRDIYNCVVGRYIDLITQGRDDRDIDLEPWGDGECEHLVLKNGEWRQTSNMYMDQQPRYRVRVVIGHGIVVRLDGVVWDRVDGNWRYVEW
jgi:hypothetical protein